MTGIPVDNVLAEVRSEIEYAFSRWGLDFDDKNTANDWVAYIGIYAAAAVKMNGIDVPFDQEQFISNMRKVASIAVGAILATERGGPALRHYDASEDEDDAGGS